MHKTTPIIACVFLLFTFSSVVYSQYNIQGRWNIKAGYSRNVSAVMFVPISENPFLLKEDNRWRSSNFRIEANYVPIRFLEVGVYTGLMTYPVEKVIGLTEYQFRNYSGPIKTESSKGLSCSFVVNDGITNYKIILQ